MSRFDNWRVSVFEHDNYGGPDLSRNGQLFSRERTDQRLERSEGPSEERRGSDVQDSDQGSSFSIAGMLLPADHRFLKGEWVGSEGRSGRKDFLVQTGS